MRSGELMQRAREAKGIKQAELAVECGISRSALGRYEVGSLRFNVEVLLKIAPILDLNPDYFQGLTKNPFKSAHANLIKFYVDKYKVHTDILLNLLTQCSSRLEIYCISPPLTVVERIRHMNISDNPVYAILIKDDINNVYIFRCKSKNDYITWDDKLISMLSHSLYLYDKPANIQKSIVSRELYEKIKDWQNLEQKDFDYIIGSKNEDSKLKNTILSESEILMVNNYRDDNIKPEDAVKYKAVLKYLIEHNIEPVEVMDYLRKKRDG
jgi:transcriptional regulator with XRE-family HTH domain